MDVRTESVALAAVIQHSMLTAEAKLSQAITFAQAQGAHDQAAKLQRVLRLSRRAHALADETARDVTAFLDGPSVMSESGGSADDKPPPPPPDPAP